MIIETNTFNVASFNSFHHKIQLLFWLEREMKIIRLYIDVKHDIIQFYDIPNNMYKLMEKVFRITREKPKTKDELFKMYIH